MWVFAFPSPLSEETHMTLATQHYLSNKWKSTDMILRVDARFIRWGRFDEQSGSGRAPRSQAPSLAQLACLLAPPPFLPSLSPSLPSFLSSSPLPPSFLLSSSLLLSSLPSSLSPSLPVCAMGGTRYLEHARLAPYHRAINPTLDF